MKIKIALLWHNVSSGNLGVGALSIGNLLIIKEIIDDLNINADLYTLGDNEVIDVNNKAKVETQIGVKFDHISFSVRGLIGRPSEFLKYHRFVRSMDIVFDIGAGDSFSDIYGLRRFFIQSFTKIHAALFAKKLILSPQTIGPFKSKVAQGAARWILSEANYVFARDRLSFECAKSMSKRCLVGLSTDVALKMPYVKNPPSGNICKVGINISGLLWNGGYSGSNDFNLAHSYRDHVKGIVEQFLQKEGICIYLISHVVATIPSAEIEDDFSAAKEIKEYFNHTENVVLIDKFTNSIDAKSFISSMDYFTGARMHATIAAFSSGVPVVPYAYSRKFSGLYNTIGYNIVLEAKELDLTSSIDMIMHNYEKRAEIALTIKNLQDNVTNLKKIYSDSISKTLSGLL